MNNRTLKRYEGQVVKYCFLPNTDPFCTNACNHCYIRSLESLNNRVKKSDARILSEIEGLVNDGYQVQPYTTELLLTPNWKNILRTVGEKKVYTNGKIVAEKHEVINEMTREGIKEMYITGNVPGYHNRLNLVNPDIINTVIGLASDAGIESIVTLLITRDSFNHLSEMIDYYEPKKVRKFNMIRVVGGTDSVISRRQTDEFLESFRKIRQENGMDMNLDSSLGKCSTNPVRGEEMFCGAGTDKVAIGLDDFIYPCSMLQFRQYRMGIFRDGEILVKKRSRSRVRLDKNDCMAYQLLKSRRIAEND